MNAIRLVGLAIGLAVLVQPSFAKPETDRNAQPIYPPVPTYPVEAISKRLSGMCDMHFDVTPSGKVSNLRAKCTSPLFCRESERAALEMKYAPKRGDNGPVWRYGVVYPLEYVIASTRPTHKGQPLEWCEVEERAIS